MSNGQHIQMLTALVLQLIQCTVVPPKTTADKEENSSSPSAEDKHESDKKVCIHKSVCNYVLYSVIIFVLVNFVA